MSVPCLKLSGPSYPLVSKFTFFGTARKALSPLLIYFWSVCLITYDSLMIRSFLDKSCHPSALGAFANVILPACFLYTLDSAQVLIDLSVSSGIPTPLDPQCRDNVLFVFVLPVSVPGTWKVFKCCLLMDEWTKEPGKCFFVFILLINRILMMHRLNPGHLNLQS